MKLNLLHAQRVSAADIVSGDRIRVHFGKSVLDERPAHQEGRLYFSPGNAPVRSFWTLVEVTEGGALISVIEGRTIYISGKGAVMKEVR